MRFCSSKNKNIKNCDDVSSTHLSKNDPSTYMANFQNILAEGNQPVMTKLYNPQVAFEFGKYLDPKSLKRQVLHSEKMKKIIDFYASQQSCSPKEIECQARDIIDEIGLERNLPIIRWCGVIITAIGKRICSGIYVNEASMTTVKQSLGRNPVLYLPSHRSYMDFILMSYICFHYDIEIPGIAAGMDFHSMFGMGTMLRKTGAFFMRRSFSTDELYWDIFREYMYALVASYHIGVEFFIEGTRSRNFKALVPKVGLLSMALLPYFTGEVPDITVVPVSVSYERVLEEQLFVYELLGVPKPKETTKGFLKALKIVDERFGKMFLDFGQPISVREFFGHTSDDRIRRAAVGGHMQNLNKQEIDLVKGLANEVIHQQQRRIVITTFNLLSLYFASQRYFAQTAPNIDELAHSILRLKEMFEKLGAHVATNRNCIKPEIIETVEIHSNIVHFHEARLYHSQVAPSQLAQELDLKKLKAHALSPHTMAIAVPTLSLQLYINPCLFWLARPAFLITAVLQLWTDKSIVIPTYADLIENLSQRVAIIDELFNQEFIMESNRNQEEFDRHLHFLEAQKIVTISKETAEIVFHENECSRLILSALAPFLCVYYQLATTLNEFPNTDEFSSKDVFISVQKRIELLMQQNIQENVHPYCLALDNLNIALHSFVQAGYLLKNRENGLLRNSCGSFVHSNSKTIGAKSLVNLENQLKQYCNLMPFKHYYEPSSNEIHILLSKL